ncbi:TonB-dependent receptor plug domain-containing protein [Hymenobacter weizhouensis]|uniref:TonB-dependent receptor plug domain-containing protein n=1 Tax=Hymenobacter sp. YIM 151500-1 TaxID=2987689 RepID=UPI0022266975|nr:TonB-dependent receptor plug domain-containing protein [Hymenobacter sp. YIM 151500-1]UYZ62699.1 TonB-dependent receptor plug domain-containing protein [Hymenobacter sp. YIM 151500-1]
MFLLSGTTKRLLSGAALLGALSLGAAFRFADTTPVQLLERLDAFYRQTFPEKSYLHLDQGAYASGETIWFKAYVVEARSHQPDTLSKVLYVDVVAPESRRVLLRRTLALRQGQAHGDLALPDTLASGVYTVRAYTSWMRNAGEQTFFNRRVPVWQAVPPATAGSATASTSAPAAAPSRAGARRTAATPPDVQFFPEGGAYVAGLETVVGVKAADASGLGLAVQGVVLDDQNQEVIRFQTPALGMSAFPLTPAPGRRYRARVTLPEGGGTREYPLPAVQPSGWVLNVREVGPNFLVLVRRQTAPGTAAAPEALQLVAHVRGLPVYAGQGQMEPGRTFSATIPRSKFPAGVAHFTVFDGQQVAQAERLAFVAPPPGLRLSLRPDKASYGPRQLVTLSLDVRDAAGQPAAANLSVAVTNQAGLPTAGTDSNTLLSHLLLTSEVKGYVQDPGYYFRAPSYETARALDHLLLTQGWSRFVWREVLAGTNPVLTYPFPLERQGLTLSGRVVRAGAATKPLPNSALTLFMANEKSVIATNANAQGDFLFMGFPGKDTTQVLLQARSEKGARNALLRLNDLWPAPVALPPAPPLPAPSPEVAQYGQRSRQQQVLERRFRPDSTGTILLRNVTVKGQKPAPRPDPRALHGNSADAVLRPDAIPGSASFTNVLELLQGRVAGVQVLRQGASYQVQIRGVSSIMGSSQPLFIIDGIAVSDVDAVVAIPVMDVERVEVLKGASAAIYGSRGGNGVIAIFTKQGNPDYDYSKQPAAGVATRRLPAYYRAREFYAPRYERASSQPDPRATTLFWAPTVQVPTSGQAQLTFYTADQAGTFRVAAEGLTPTGDALGAEAVLAVTK